MNHVAKSTMWIRDCEVKHVVSGVTAAVVLVLATMGSAAGQCMQWDSSIQLPAGGGSTNALAAFNNGSVSVMYTNIGGVVYGWTGAAWAQAGSTGLDGDVWALHEYDDGSGPALYAGGVFTHLSSGTIPRWGIAKLVGSVWESVGAGIPVTVGFPFSLAVFDDGSGPKLYVAGMYDSIGTLTDSILAWDGVAWSGLGGGLVGTAFPYVWPSIEAMCVYDDGNGPALYVGGILGSASGIPADNVAKWDGSTWSALGSGVTGGGQYPAVNTLVVYDDGSGPALYVGGQFTSAGGVPVNGVAKWNGATWSSIPGVSPTPPGNAVRALTTHDDGNGMALYASGNWLARPTGTTGPLLRLDGSTWSSVGGVVLGANSLLSFDDGQGRGRALVVGGEFPTVVGGNLTQLARDSLVWRLHARDRCDVLR